MKKKLFSTLAIAAVFVPATFGLAGCSNTPDPVSVHARDVYAMSALSSISYLSSQDNSPAQQNLGSRPTNITQFDVDGVKSSLSLFDSTIDNGGFLKTVKDNTSQEDILKDYDLQMDISFPGAPSGSKICTMYFTETDTKTNTELEEGVEEIETNTRFEGVISYNSQLYIVRGETEVEIEGNKRESSIEFRTYKNAGTTTLDIDYKNYVQIEQSVEHNEIEYEYTLVKDGKIDVEMELEYEQNNNGAEIEFQLIDRNIRQATEYKIYKGTADDKFVVVITKNNTPDSINVTKQPDGDYEFTYTGGFVETV